MPPFTIIAAATPCRHCPEPAYAVWHLPRGLGRVWLCKQHWARAIDRPDRTVSLIPEGAIAPRRVDDDPPPLLDLDEQPSAAGRRC